MLVCLQVLMEKIIAVEQEVFIMFIEYSKAFDSVSHYKLLEAFLEMGFPLETSRGTLKISVCEPKSNNKMEW